MIDLGKVEKDAMLDGLKGYTTNSSMSDDQVVEEYGYLFMIKRAFRMCKTDLDRGRKINCVMLCSRSNSSDGDGPAPRGGTTRPEEREVTTI